MMDRLVTFVAWMGVASAIGFAVYAIVESVRSNGDVDYCYFEMWSPTQMAPQWQLYAHRPWRPDRMMGVYPTPEDARRAADTMSCKLNAR